MGSRAFPAPRRRAGAGRRLRCAPETERGGGMANRDKLSREAIEAFIAGHPGWARAGDMLVKTYSFKHYGQAMGFAVHVGFAAEKRDHHPNLHIFWGKVTVEWSTHDA